MGLRFCCYIALLVATTAAAVPDISVVDTNGDPVRAQVQSQGGRLIVTAPGFLPWSGPLQTSAPGAIKVTLLHAASVRGRVVADGLGLAGAHVTIRNVATAGHDLAATTTNSKGVFDLKDLPPADLHLIVAADQFLPTEQAIALMEGEARWVEMAPRRSATLRLRVTGADGRPLQAVGARVRTEGADGRVLPEDDRPRLADLRGSTDQAGKLALGPLDRGVRQRVVLRRDSYAPQSILVTPEAEVVERALRLRRGGEIRIAFRDREERPVAGVVGEPASDDAPDVDLLDAPLPSRQDGVLHMGGLPGGTYVLRLRAPGFRPVTMRGVAVRPGRTSDLGLVTLEPGASVAGSVFDEDGAPVKGAVVRARFFENGRRLTAEAESDIEGRFVVSGLPDQELEMEIEAGGFFPETRDVVRSGSENLRVVLSRTGSIRGRVFDSRTGLPIPVFSIDLAPRARNEWGKEEKWRTAKTITDFDDPEGRFEVAGLREQTYGLIVRARGYRAADVVEVEARASQPETIAVPLDAGGAVAGVVVDDDSGAPIAGVKVRSEEGDPILTDLEGRFRIRGLDGRTVLRVEHPLYVTKIVDHIEPDAAALLEIRLERGGSVEGSVFGPGGAPAPGVEVILEDDERVSIVDAAGHYRLDGVPPGERILRKVDRSGAFGGSETAVVTIRQGEVTNYDFGRGMRLYGVVTRGGAPASGALLTLAPAGSRTTAALPIDESTIGIQVREDGFYEARGLRPGTYGLTLVWESRTIAGRQVTLEEGAVEQRLDLEIPDLWLSGTLVDVGTGTGVGGIVSVAKLNGGTDGSSGFVGGEDGQTMPYSSFPQAQSESDGSGRFRVSLMEPGTYSVTAFAEGYRMEKLLEVDIEASRNDLRLELAPAITLVVNASDAVTGAPLTTDCVSFLAGTNRTTACGAEAKLDFLSPGVGVASAYVQGYAPGYQKVELRNEHHEVAISLTRGGTLRLLLPPQVDSIDAARQKYALRIEDTDGTDILFGRYFDFARSEESTIQHVPAEPLRIRIGGGTSGIPEKYAEASVSEGEEAIADLR